jgi:HEPN domain-containing protein
VTPALTFRDFQRAAAQRLTTAEFLLENGFTLDATYLAGYAIECSLKSLILHATPPADRAATLAKISSRSTMHNPEILGAELK